MLEHGWSAEPAVAVRVFDQHWVGDSMILAWMWVEGFWVESGSPES
jgi:hypothetical protein